MEIQKNMYAVSVTVRGTKSFQLIPVTIDCPYLDGIYDPEFQSLRLTGKSRVQRVVWVQKVDNCGIPEHCGPAKTTKHNKGFKVERMFVEEEMEYFINDPREIEEFVRTFVVNAEGWELELYPKPLVKEPEVPIIPEGGIDGGVHLKVEPKEEKGTKESLAQDSSKTAEEKQNFPGPTKL